MTINLESAQRFRNVRRRAFVYCQLRGSWRQALGYKTAAWLRLERTATDTFVVQTGW